MRPKLLAFAGLFVWIALGLIGPASASTPDGSGPSTGSTNTQDMVVLSGKIEVRSGQTVGEVVIFSGPVQVDGSVQGDVVALSGDVVISGYVGGDVVSLNGTATIEDGAKVGGDIIARDTPIVAPGATVTGQIQDVHTLVFTAPKLLGWFLWWLPVTVSTMLLGLVMLWLAPRGLDAIVMTGLKRPGPAVGWGFAIFFGLPVAAVLLMVTLLGLPFGVGLLLALALIYSIGFAAGSWFLGRQIVKGSRAGAWFVGWGILRGLAVIPFMAGPSWFAATLFGLGTITVAMWRARRDPIAAPPAAATGYDPTEISDN